jgi:hypothetical protein
MWAHGCLGRVGEVMVDGIYTLPLYLPVQNVLTSLVHYQVLYYGIPGTVLQLYLVPGKSCAIPLEMVCDF